MHLVFYDGECGLCDHIVQFLLKRDSRQQFLFAPLQGKTADKVLKENNINYQTQDTLVFIERYQTEQQRIFLFGKGALRICWTLGGVWTIPGLISFLPGFLYNWAYRLVAKNRHRFFSQSCIFLTQKKGKQFLP
jgi:predicted DCC family thiol-disulfide oxidoreductase YuxK